MADSTFLPLADPTRSHLLKLEIFRPDGLLYKTFTGDTNDGSGDFSSMPTSKALDTPTTSITAILNVALPDRLIYSRQMVSWRAKVSCTSYSFSVSNTVTLFEGIVTSASVRGAFTSLDISNKTRLLDSINPITLSNNCPLLYGSTACGQTKTGFWVAPTVITSSAFTIPLTVFTPSTTAKYVAVVGDSSYQIINFNQPIAGSINQITVQNAPIALPDWVRVETTCNQTIQQCRAYGNSARYRGCVLPRDPLSFR